jgi:5-methylcytosine-specific restriction enzyme A
MPTAPGRLCPRCSGRVAAGAECPTCRPPFARSTNGHWQGGSTWQYRIDRESFLVEHPWCRHDGTQWWTTDREPCHRLADQLDHIDPDLPDRSDQTNWQGLCVDHHEEKSRAESSRRASSTSSSSPRG